MLPKAFGDSEFDNDSEENLPSDFEESDKDAEYDKEQSAKGCFEHSFNTQLGKALRLLFRFKVLT